MRDISVKQKNFYVEGYLIATGYSRLVKGGRGAYLEIPPECIIQSELEVQPGQEYRLENSWKDKVYYAWYRTKETCEKVYFQYMKTSYADYLVGYYYIDPRRLTYEGKLYTEKSKRPLNE